MVDALLPFLLVLAAIYVWQSSLRARERARHLGHELCAAAGVQLLDQTVSLQKLKLTRGEDGRLHWRRRYRFEISTNGADRHLGTLDMAEDRLLSHSLPLMGPLPSVRPVIDSVSDADATGSNVIAFPERRTLH